MPEAILEKNTKAELTEKDILNSLDAAIATYSVKDFQSIALPKVKTSRVNRANKAKKAIVPQKKVKSSKKVKKTGYFFSRKSKSKSENRLTKKEMFKLSKTGPFTALGNFFSNFYTNYKKQIFTLSLTAVMVGFIGLTSYIAYAYVAGNNADIVRKVGVHVVLPAGETPKVYIIQSEKSDIFQNPLFKGIEVGDNVLTYPNAGKVYIYRGSEDKVVNIVNTTQ